MAYDGASKAPPGSKTLDAIEAVAYLRESMAMNTSQALPPSRRVPSVLFIPSKGPTDPQVSPKPTKPTDPRGKHGGSSPLPSPKTPGTPSSSICQRVGQQSRQSTYLRVDLTETQQHHPCHTSSDEHGDEDRDVEVHLSPSAAAAQQLRQKLALRSMRFNAHALGPRPQDSFTLGPASENDPKASSSSTAEQTALRSILQEPSICMSGIMNRLAKRFSFNRAAQDTHQGHSYSSDDDDDDGDDDYPSAGHASDHNKATTSGSTSHTPHRMACQSLTPSPRGHRPSSACISPSSTCPGHYTTGHAPAAAPSSQHNSNHHTPTKSATKHQGPSAPSSPSPRSLPQSPSGRLLASSNRPLQHSPSKNGRTSWSGAAAGASVLVGLENRNRRVTCDGKGLTSKDTADYGQSSPVRKLARSNSPWRASHDGVLPISAPPASPSSSAAAPPQPRASFSGGKQSLLVPSSKERPPAANAGSLLAVCPPSPPSAPARVAQSPRTSTPGVKVQQQQQHHQQHHHQHQQQVPLSPSGAARPASGGHRASCTGSAGVPARRNSSTGGAPSGGRRQSDTGGVFGALGAVLTRM